MIDQQAFQKAVNLAVTEALQNFALGTLAPKSEYLSIKQLCDELEISGTTAERFIREEGLPVIKIGNTRRIRRKALEEWLSKREHVNR